MLSNFKFLLFFIFAIVCETWYVAIICNSSFQTHFIYWLCAHHICSSSKVYACAFILTDSMMIKIKNKTFLFHFMWKRRKSFVGFFFEYLKNCMHDDDMCFPLFYVLLFLYIFILFYKLCVLCFAFFFFSPFTDHVHMYIQILNCEFYGNSKSIALHCIYQPKQ